MPYVDWERVRRLADECAAEMAAEMTTEPVCGHGTWVEEWLERSDGRHTLRYCTTCDAHTDTVTG